MAMLSLLVAFAIAAVWRARRWRGGPFGILVGAAVVPVAVLFESFVYPAVSEAGAWWQVSVSVALALGLAAASAGYVLAAIGSRRIGA